MKTANIQYRTNYTPAAQAIYTKRENAPQTRQSLPEKYDAQVFRSYASVGNNISFTALEPAREQTVPRLDFEEYKEMSDSGRALMRKRCENFAQNEAVTANLIDQKHKYLPLGDEKTMDEFIKTSSIYKKYKDQPIICLGRSPKWFLNAALWMRNGIDNYDYVAFSHYWFNLDANGNPVKIKSVAPKPQEEAAYLKYLQSKQVDPLSIVKKFETTGKKTVITDYINSGKGVTSFLDVM